MDAINNKTEKWLNSMCDNLGLDEETKKKKLLRQIVLQERIHNYIKS